MNLATQNAIATGENYEQTILIVDDNPTNLGVLSNYLKTYGFRILVARNGESALQKAQYVQPDLILLDVLMPGIDGFETCQKLKTQRSTKSIPVIFMTALAEATDKVKGFQAGGVDYVTKPLQFEEVLARVNTHLRIRNLTKNLQDQAIELQKTNSALVKRTIQLETSSQLGREVTSIIDLDELLARVVELIRSKFNYYFVGIWLLDDMQTLLRLRAGANAEGVPLPGNELQISVKEEKSAVARVARTCKHFVADEITKASKTLALAHLWAARSELVLPLRIGSECIGAFEIMHDEPAAFASNDILALQALADHTAIAIRNAEFYKVEQQRRRLAESLEYTGRVLTGTLNMRHVPGRILEELATVVPYERGSVLLQKGDKLHSVAQRGYPTNSQTPPMNIPLNSGDIFQRITKTRRPLLISDVTKDEGWQQLDWLPINHSWLGVPMISRNKVIGMISLTRRQVGAFSLDEATMVLGFAGQAGIALENARLYDEITQLNHSLEQKVAERTEELNKAYQMLERLDKTKTDFINVTSHELRTPLSVIKGYTQILDLLPTVNQDEKARDMLRGINTGVDRLHQIVNTMLDVARIDAEMLHPHPDEIRLDQLIKTIRDQFEDALQERCLSLSLSHLDNLPKIEADPDLLPKLFYNLIVNAIKYTPDGGRITIEGHKVAPPDAPGYVEIVISDTGIGIDPEHHEQIFEKFYQTGEVSLHSTGRTKFKGGGPGLGLAIVRGIVLAHGGQVWVESERYDEENCPGSRFYVRLPVNLANANSEVDS